MADIFRRESTTLQGSTIPGTAWADIPNVFDSAIRNDNNVVASFDNATAQITLPATISYDGYIFLYRLEFEDSSNGRHNPQGRFIQQGGSADGFVTGHDSGYNRDASEDRSFLNVWAVVAGPSGSSTFRAQWKRDTDAPNAADGPINAHIEAIPINFDAIGMYTSASTSLYGGTTPNTVTGWAATYESDTAAIQLSGNEVTLQTDNRSYSLFGSFFAEGYGGTRTQRLVGFLADQGIYNCGYFYPRNANNDECGSTFHDIIRRTTTDIDVGMYAFRGPGVAAFDGGADVDGSAPSAASHSMVIIEWGSDAEVFRTRDATGNQEIALAGPVDLNIARTGDIQYNDAAAFTRASDTGINCEKAMDVLGGANVHAAQGTITTGNRYTCSAHITLNGAEQANTEAGDYQRNNQGSADTFGWAANPIGVIQVAANDDLGVSCTELAGSEGGAGNVETQDLASDNGITFHGLNIDSVQGSGSTADQTASGSPSLPAVTSTGVAEAIKTATGSPTLPAITASGDGFLWPKVYLNTSETLTGATELTVVSANAAGTSLTFDDPVGAPTGSLFLGIENRNNSAVGWIAVTVNASGADQTASGSPSISVPTASGVAEIEKTASGTPSLVAITSSGQGFILKTASGAPVVPLILAVGSAEIEKAASGSPSLPAITGTGSAEIQKTASGSPSIPAITGSGAATIEKPASGSPSLPAVTSAGAAEIEKTASGSPALPAPTSSGTATVGGALVASGSPDIPSPTTTGDAEIEKTASGSPSIPAIVSTGNAEIEKTASGAPSIPAVESAGSAEVEKTASGSPVLPAITSTGEAELETTASGSPTIPAIISAGSASVEGAVSASGAPSTPAIDASGTGVVEKTASGAPSIPAVESTGSAEVEKTASGSPTLPAIISSGSGRIIRIADGSPAIPAVISVGVATSGAFIADRELRINVPAREKHIVVAARSRTLRVGERDKVIVSPARSRRFTVSEKEKS